MNLKRVFPTLTVTAACTLGAVPLASAKADAVQQATSGNWSGYVVGAKDNRTYKSVTGSWVQPTATCDARDGDTYGAFWVGLGGVSSAEALEQDGTEVNCSAEGRATYYAWYELVPKAPVKVDLAVHPGDHMTATTTVNGHDVTESIVNQTTGASFTKTLTMANPDVSSAEWIAEAPSQCRGSVNNCTALSLTNFGEVAFTSATATDSTGHTGSPSDAEWQTAALTLDSSQSAGAQYVGLSSGGGATPSALSGDGSSFSVTYRRSTASAGYGGGGYGGYGGGGYGYSSGGAGYGYPQEYAYPTGNGGYVIVYAY